MRTALTRGLAILFLLAVLVQPACPQSGDAVRRQLDALFSPLAGPSDPGCAVLVKQKGINLLETGYGVRDLRTRAKTDPQTNFRLASVTKQFTAMAVMLLIRDGKLHDGDRLTDIFPEFPAYGKNITIHHLLTHSSGLLDYEDLMDKEEKAKGPIWSAEHQVQDAEVLSLLERTTTGKFAPGTSWEYSNSGYVVLGLIIAKASGMPYRDFLQKRIFTPAGMNHSIVYQKGINDVSDRAFGHSKEGSKFTVTDQSSTSATLGDGGIYSNLEDMSKWDDALAKHTLLSEKEFAPALVPVKLADGSDPHWPSSPDENSPDRGKPISYGFGWFLNPWDGHPRMRHGGETIGFHTEIQRFTNDGLTVVILCNRLDLNPRTLAEQAAAIMLNK